MPFGFRDLGRAGLKGYRGRTRRAGDGPATKAIFKLFTAAKAECQELNSPALGAKPSPVNEGPFEV